MSSTATAWSHGIPAIGVHDPRPSRAGHDLVRRLGIGPHGPRGDDGEDRHGG